MRAILVKKGWISNGFEIQYVPFPKIKDGEVLISVSAVGIHKDDLLKNHNGVCPGVECSGTIEVVGSDVTNWKVGDEVCAIIERGGYADKVAVPASLLLPVPEHMPLDDAANLPHALCTIWLALFKGQEKVNAIGHLLEKVTVKGRILIHEGASKIGLLAIKVAKYMGFQVIATTGSDQDIPVCLEYGADECINYKTTDFVAFVKAKAGAVHFVLDFKGSNLEENLRCCFGRGRVIILKLDDLGKERINLGNFVVNHNQVKVIDFSSQSLEDKILIIEEVRKSLWAAIEGFKFFQIHKFPMEEASRAHKLLRKIETKGFIILCNSFKKREMVDESAELRNSRRQKLE